MSDELMKLPEGWVAVNLETTVKDGRIGLVRSAKEQSTDQGFPYVRMQHYDLEGNWNSKDLTKVSASPTEAKIYELQEGDILFNTRNSYELVGKVAIWQFQKFGYLYNNNLLRLRFYKGILPKWIGYQMMAPQFRSNLESFKSATTSVCAIYTKDLNSQTILLPPLNEQKRIVAAIESLRERSQKARSALSAIPELCDKFRQSVLAAAFRGDLTADWREQNPDVEPASVVLERIRLERRLKWQEKELRRMKFQGKTPKDDKWKQKYKEPDKIEELADIELPDLPDGWVWLSADECTSWITDGEHATPERSEEGIYLLSARNVLNGRVSLDKVDFVSEQVHRKLEERLKIEPGDVFLSCSGTVGRSCVVPPDVQCSLVRSVAVLKPLFEMGEYLSLSIRSPYVQSQIEQKKTQTAQSNIFQGRIKTLAIPIAPLYEQKVIIEQITEAFRFIQSVEQIIQLLDDRGEHLDRSILAKAFRGELVEQDPNDEPAAVLLERIRVDREQQMQGKIKKPGKKKRTGD